MSENNTNLNPKICPENLRPFNKLCITIGMIPSSYKASLTYEEQLLWFCNYLQETVIPAVNNNAEALTELQNLYIQLKNYVDNYFTNLDVQNEINNKLDQMTLDGTLTSLIGEYVQPFVNEQNKKIEDINTKVNNAVGITPIPVDSVSKMTDTSKIYINTSDGNWYYYNGSNWKIGGIYQATGINDGEITPIMTSFMKQIDLFPENEWVLNKILQYTDGVELNFEGASYSKKYVKIDKSQNKLVYLGNKNINFRIYYYDENYNFLESSEIFNNNIVALNNNASYFRVGFQSDLGHNYNYLFYYDQFINASNIYVPAKIKDNYIDLQDYQILYNQKKLNILPTFFAIMPTYIFGNKIEFNILENQFESFIGFCIKFNAKENDIIKVFSTGSYTPSQMALFNTNENNFNINTNSPLGGFNKKNNEFTKQLLSSDIASIKNNSFMITFDVPTNTQINCSFIIQINDDYYYFSDLLKSYEKGKKSYSALFLGDSITALTGDRAWINYFNNIINVTNYQNIAVAGATLHDKINTVYDGNPSGDNPENNVLGNQVQKIINNNNITPDFILIAIGTNDGILFENINSIQNTYYNNDGSVKPLDQVDRKTDTGAFRYCNEKLHELYQNAIIVWCTPIQANEKMRPVKNIINYGNNLKLLCSFGSNICLDTEKCGINGLYEKENANGEDLIDGLHPNSHGAKKMGLYNASEFKRYLNMIS